MLRKKEKKTREGIRGDPPVQLKTFPLPESGSRRTQFSGSRLPCACWGGWSSTCTKLSHYTSWVVFADLFPFICLLWQKLEEIGLDSIPWWVVYWHTPPHFSGGSTHCSCYDLWRNAKPRLLLPFHPPFFSPLNILWSWYFFVPNGFVKTWRVASAAGGYIIQPMCQTSSPLSARLRKIAGGRWNIYRRRRHNLQSIDRPPLLKLLEGLSLSRLYHSWWLNYSVL
jgi:hypothetical protein